MSTTPRNAVGPDTAREYLLWFPPGIRIPGRIPATAETGDGLGLKAVTVTESITKDQLNLLKIDNVQSGKYKTNFDLGVPSICNFELEVEKYCAMWRNRGQYSKKNFN